MSAAELLLSLELGLIYAIVAIGIYYAFRVIDFPDLTCDGSFVLGAAASSVALKYGCNPYFALILAVGAGGIAGLGTAFINLYLRVTNLLSGILMAFMLYSINLKVMNGIPNLTLIDEVTIFTNHNPLLILSLVGGAVWFVASYLLCTNFGLALRSVGQNKTLSVNNGVNIKSMTIIALALSNGLIALSGAIFSQHQGFVDVSQGLGTIIVGLAAILLGEKLIPWRSPWYALLACFVGSFVYRLLVSWALHSEALGLDTQDLNLITGIMFIAIMFMPRKKACLN